MGAQGVPLTPGRSIAVDKIHVYGTPFFIEADLPIASERPNTKFRRLMVAQDTGSAIIGPARADLYWGAGDDAGRIAGRIRHQGRFTMLFPRELDMVEAGKQHAAAAAASPMHRSEGRAEGVPEKKAAATQTSGEKCPLAGCRAQQAQPMPKPKPTALMTAQPTSRAGAG